MTKKQPSKPKPTSGPGSKPALTTSAEMEKRIAEVFNLLVAGTRRCDIIRHGEKQGWDVSTRTIDKYIQRATAEIREAATVDKTAELGRAITRLHKLYQSSQRVQDHKTSLAVQKELTATLGLAAAAKIEVSGAVTISDLGRLAAEGLES